MDMDYDLRSLQHARDLARKGKIAAEQLASFTQDQVDRIVENMVRVAEANALMLGKMAVEETGYGIPEDKAYKNHLASGLLYESIKDMKTVGIVYEDPVHRVLDVMEPMGLILGISPSTNPTSTIIYKAIISLKARNPIVFSVHPSAQRCSEKAVDLMNQAAMEAGAPANVVTCVTMPSMGATNELMKCDEVKLIIATGGPGMVKAAYSAGKPALGVGAGNSPAYIERTANIPRAVRNIMASKTFDNGTICASEQSIIVEESNRQAVIEEFKRQGGYFMTSEETEKVCNVIFKNGTAMNGKFVGKKPQVIADAAGIQIPQGTRVLIGEQRGVGKDYPLSFEKLTTVLAFYTVRDWEEACALSFELLENGIGHTMSLHTEDEQLAKKFSIKPASRILVNTGGTHGGTGISTGLAPALTLGCGTWGGSSVSDNVGPQHLLNRKRMAWGLFDSDQVIAQDKSLGKWPTDANYGQYTQASSSYSALSQNTCSIPTPQDTPDPNRSGISYSVGCNTCSSNQAPMASDEGIDIHELENMINELAKALRGE